MKKTIALILLAATVIMSSAEVLSEEAPAPAADIREALTGAGYMLITERGGRSLYLQTGSGEFTVTDGQGFAWYSNPKDKENDSFAKGIARMNLFSQLIVRFVNTADRSETTANSYTASVAAGGAVFSKIENGFAAVYSFPEQDVTIPVEVTLQDGYVNICLRYNNIEERGGVIVRSISLLPYFCAGGVDDTGYILVPDGCGALIRFNNGRQSADIYKEEVYGLDAAVLRKSMMKFTQGVTMPVFGVQSTDSGMFAVIDSGAANMSVNAEVSLKKTSYNTAYPSFEVRQPIISAIGQQQVTDYPAQKIDIGDINVRYYLYQGTGGYNRMASLYRDYLMNEKGMKMADKPAGMYLEVLNSYQRKASFLGIPYKKTEELTTFDETREMAERLLSKGVDNLALTLRNYSGSTVSGALAETGGYLGALGGSKGFAEFQSDMKRRGVQVYLMVGMVRYSKSGNWFSPAGDAVRNSNNSPAKTYNYSLSTYTINTSKTFYLLHPFKLAERMNGFIKSLEKEGIDGVAIGDMTSTVYADSGKRQPASKTRAVQAFEQALSALSQKADLLAPSSNAYAFPYLDHIVSAPSQSSMFGIEDESVPFYQMALSGLVSCSVPAINLSSAPQRLILKAIETGSAPYYILADHDGKLLEDDYYQQYYSIDCDDWLDIAAAQYTEINRVLTAAGDRVIASHEKLAEDVYKTTFANGASVIVNYGGEAYESGGGTVGPMDYLLIGA